MGWKETAMRILLLIAMVLTACGGIVKKEVETEFRVALGKTSVTVYPVVVRSTASQTGVTWDEQAAKELANWIEKQGLARVVMASDQINIAAKPGVNQAKMFRSSMTSFGEWVKANPPKTEYALAAEYLMWRKGTVAGVHVYVVRKDGEFAYGTLLNSHWKEFKEVKPVSVQDATRVAIRKLNRDLIEKR
jgi:hypothetical protein